MSKIKKDISALRENYTKGFLTEDKLVTDPIDFFREWFEAAQASDILEPNAMTISTVNHYGQPSARVVLLKAIDHQGLVFYSNYNSQKAKELEYNSAIAATFLWKELERQVRIQGVAVKISRAESEAYYHSRPKKSQLGAWASEQSQVIQDRAVLEEKMQSLEAQYKDVDQVPIPPHWGGYRIMANRIEFWQGRPSRLHDRLCYEKEANKWKISRLSP